MIGRINGLSETWLAWVAAGAIEGLILLAVAAGICLLARRKLSASAAYWLFVIVLVKAVLPLGLALPGRVVAQIASVSTAVNERPSRPAAAIPTQDGIERTLPAEPSHATVSNNLGKETPATELASASPVLAPAIGGPDGQITWQAVAMFAWLGVVLSLLTRMMVEQWRLRRLLRSAPEAALCELGIDLDGLQTRFGLRATLRAVGGSAGQAPAVTGIMRPTLILPPDWAHGMNSAQREWVLLHELAHVRRHDLAALLVQRVITIVGCCNPAVWLASWSVDHYRECACDELALEYSDCERWQCGVAFVELLSLVHRLPPAPGLGLSAGHLLLRRRLERLVDPRRVANRLWSRCAIAMMLLVACMAFAKTSVGQGERSGIAKSRPQLVAAQTNDASKRTTNAAESAAQVPKTPISSGIVRFRLLRLQQFNPDSIQQGRPLAAMQGEQVEALLDSIDFVGNEQCLREVRDRVVAGSLILDHPAYHLVTLSWHGDKRRIDWDDQEVLIFDGRETLLYQPRQWQATIRPTFSGAMSDTGLTDYLRFIVGRFSTAFAPESILETPLGPLQSDEKRRTQLDELGQLFRRDELTRLSLISHRAYREYPGGVRLPQVRIEATFDTGWQAANFGVLRGTLSRLTISVIEKAEFNQHLPDALFRLAVPENTAVWDRRAKLKLRAAEVPVDDVLSLFDEG